MVAGTAQEALANAYRYSRCVEGKCLAYVRTWLEIGPHWPTASKAWANAAIRHGGDRNAPAGAPMFWTGGSHGFGHIALSTGGGYVRSTDVPAAGMVRTIPLTWFDDHWPNLHHEGWAEDLNETVIPWLAPPPPPLPKPPEGVLPEMFMYRSPDGTKAFMVVDGHQIYMDPGAANAALTPLSGAATKPLYFQATAEFVHRLGQAFGAPIT